MVPSCGSATAPPPEHDFSVLQIGDSLFFKAYPQLWRTDGSEAGTVPVAGIGEGLIYERAGKLIVTDGPRFGTTRILASDGTARLIELTSLRDSGIIYGQDGEWLEASGGTLFFSASADDLGRELWGIPIAALPAVCERDCIPSFTATPAPTSTPPVAPTPTEGESSCPCDCDSNGAVTVDELLRTTTIALTGGAAECPGLEPTQLATVDVGYVLSCVDIALKGCRPRL